MFNATFFHKLLLVFVLYNASIAHLYADTNTQPTNITQEAPEIAQKNEEITPLVQQCRALAENFEFMAALLLNVKSSYGPQLIYVLTPILSLTQSIKELPGNATNDEIHKAFSLLLEGALYLHSTLEKGLENAEEFNPTLTPTQNTTPADIELVIEKLNGTFKELMVKIDEFYQDLLGNMRMHVQSQLNKLDSILQAIITNISNNSSIVNKKDITKDIRELRNTLRQIQKEAAAAGSNPQMILSIHQVNRAIIRYLQEAQKHKFRKWVVVDLAQEVMRGNDSENPEQTLEELFMEIMRSNSDLENLAAQAEKIDLTVINKIARLAGDYIVDPIERYSLDAWTACIVFGGLYGAYYFDDNFFKSKDSLFRKIFGFRDHSLGKNMIVDDLNKDKPIKWFGKTEGFIHDQIHNITPVGAILCVMIKDRLQLQWKDMKPDLARHLRRWFNKIRGGSFAKKTEKYDVIYPTTTFDEIIGLEYEKSLIYPHLKYIKDPERWDANELSPPTGILLTGPTRSGKTFFAKAICGELHKENPDKNIKFISIDAHDIKEGGIGSWMQLAKIVAPCVLFIDEIDLLGLQRNQDKTLLADFLQALSGVADKDPKKQVIVIGTTNKPENIDTAMIQSGRLALEIRFHYPNTEERKEFIKKRLDKFAIDPEIFEIDVEKLARETNGKSFEDIKLMIDTAFIHVGIKGQIISQNILEWALDTQLRKIIDIDQKQIAPDEKKLIAAHFAGQALVHILLNLNEKIAKITIRQVVVKVKEESVYEQYYNQTKQTGLEQGAIFTYLENDTLDIKSQEEVIKKAKTLLGARIAERIITNSCSTFFDWKKNAAFNMIKTIITDGIDIKSISKNGQGVISDQTLENIKLYEKEIEQLLLQHKPALIAIADALQTNETLTMSTIVDIISKVEGTSNMVDTQNSAIAVAA